MPKFIFMKGQNKMVEITKRRVI